MRFKFLLIAILAVGTVAVSAQQTRPGQIQLASGWKFNPADNPSHSTVGLDDKDWKPINVNQTWGEQGHPDLRGIAWYRLKFNLPRALRDQDALKGGLYLALGRIANGDQVYLNGEYLGTSGRTVNPGTNPPPNFRGGAAGQERIYRLPIDDPRLKWGQENLIAVRVSSAPNAPGGMLSGGQFLRVARIKDFLDFQAQARSFTFIGPEVVKNFDIVNNSAISPMQGTLTIDAVAALSGRKVAQNTRAIDIAPSGKLPINLQLGQRDEAVKISYHLVFKDGDSFEYTEESPYILTPPVSNMPKINGATVFGARPGKPFMYTVAASGERPLTYSASGLPEGLRINPRTGIISGTTPSAGTYKVALTVTNTRGTASRDFQIVSGEKLALTPPMGWNSWNVWGLSVDEEKVMASATTFVEKGLRDHGWMYINIDDGWEIRADSPDPKRHPNGDIIVNNKFPDMARLGRRIHDLGLKFGIYSGPGPRTCGGYTASWQYEENDARSYASWGVDYLKYDWCAYSEIEPDRTSLPGLKRPYELMSGILAKQDRDIVLSLCQYGWGRVWEWGASVGGQLWRTTGDITDTWASMSRIGFSQVDNAPYAGPGAWNDPDMLVLGWVGWGPNLRNTRLTPDEQYTHMSLWCLLSSPLLLGCDPTRLDQFTLNLLTNDEVIAINQDVLGKQATPKVIDGQIQVWVKELSDGGRAIGVFNLGDAAVDYEINLAALGLTGEKRIRDLWRQRDINLNPNPQQRGSGPLPEKYSTRVASHGVTFIKVI